MSRRSLWYVAAVAGLAASMMLPPFQTPHSTMSPGMPCAHTCSSARTNAIIRSGAVWVYGVTASMSSW